MSEIVHGHGESYFAFALPVESSWEGELASVTLSGPGGSAVLDGNTHRPMAIGNPRTGQVHGILRDPPVAVSADGAVVADGASPVGQDIEVLFSRGLPGSQVWRR